MTRFLPLLALGLTLTACQPDAPADDADTGDVFIDSTPTGELVVSGAFVSATPIGGTGGVFMTVTGGAEPDTLIGADSDLAERIEVHETYADGDLRGMREVEGGVAVPAGEIVALAPGGYHVMLMNLGSALAVGDTLDLDLNFAAGGTVPVRVPVVSMDAIMAGE